MHFRWGLRQFVRKAGNLDRTGCGMFYVHHQVSDLGLRTVKHFRYCIDRPARNSHLALIRTSHSSASRVHKGIADDFRKCIPIGQTIAIGSKSWIIF